jgi:hypothetical protein
MGAAEDSRELLLDQDPDSESTRRGLGLGKKISESVTQW